MRRMVAVALGWVAGCGSLLGQTAPDAGLAAMQAWIGRALIVRGFYAGGELEFDAAGHVKGAPKTTDWTLAGMDLEKVSRRATGEFLLEGTRVAIGYNAGGHVFERHPLKDEKMKVVLPGAADERAVDAEVLAAFSQGMDPALQKAMPAYWSHYFIPALPWPADEVTGKTILGLNGTAPADLVMPVPEKKVDPEFTNEARTLRVRGSVQVQMAVDTEGVPRRITIRVPLGYGLDARVVEAVGRYRFKPGTQGGVPVVAEVIFNQPLDTVVVPVR